MAIKEIERSFIFPRIPLCFDVPKDYPAIGNVSNIAVVPEVTGFRYAKNELELEGNYQLAISYYKAAKDDKNVEAAEVNDSERDDFFSYLKLEEDGLFKESINKTGTAAENVSELYTVHFSRPFHTYVDLEFINRPRSFKPAMVVEKVNLEPDKDGGRVIKGELVLGLINRVRRNY